MKRLHFGNRCGMSVVELLASVSIVLVLSSLLLPALRHMTDAAQSSGCLSNLRKMGGAFQLYAADNNGYLPAPRFRGDWDEGKNPSQGNWQTEIHPYLSRNVSSFSQLKSSQELQVICPTYLAGYKKNADLQKLQALGYGMNPRTISNNFDYRFSAAAIAKPTSTVLVGDSDDYHLTADSWNEGPDSSGKYTSGDPVRHREKANYLFVDGHVETLKPDQAKEVLILRP